MLFQQESYRAKNHASHLLIKKIFWGVILLVGVIFLWRIFFRGSGIWLGQKNLLSVQLPTDLEFCGEAVPLENFYVQEAWQREFFIALNQDYQNILYLKRAPKYLPLIETELKKRNLPDDLKYIAVAESGLVEGVRSAAGAEGIWQFVSETARRYGLIVNEQIDERHNFEKATHSALTYLEKLHTDFRNWTLAVASYNVGENGLARRLLEQKVNNYYDLELPTETERYVFRILAIKKIMEHPEDYGYALAEADYFSWPNLKIKTVSAIDNLVNFAQTNQTNVRTVRELNPWIIDKTLPSGEWKIRLAE